MGSVVETKVAVGSFAGVVTGLLTWALVAYIPAFRNGIPDQLAPFIPVVAAWLCSTAAAYMAPHTHRPDLPAAVVKPAQANLADLAARPDVTMTPIGPVGPVDPATGRTLPTDPPPPARLTP